MERKKRLLGEATCTDTDIEMDLKTDLKNAKELVETFVSTVGKNQHQAVKFVDMKLLMDMVKDLKIVLVTESVQYGCVGVVYKKKTTSNYKKGPAELSILEPDRIECYNNESCTKPSHSTCKYHCCDYRQCNRDQSLNLNNSEVVASKPKKRKWMSIFG